MTDIPQNKKVPRYHNLLPGDGWRFQAFAWFKVIRLGVVMLYVHLYQMRLMALSELRLMFGAILLITPLIYVSGDG